MGLFSSHKAQAFHTVKAMEILFYDYDTGKVIGKDCTLCDPEGICIVLACNPINQD